ncbi:MAG TPA: Nif3-like dinuclear metal center hexameric protein, partial [Burkholderiaceae bacterium]|nr:Nif3-like dinuclear metal center hexameric protein [Burkholderiaceae bacterium]
MKRQRVGERGVGAASAAAVPVAELSARFEEILDAGAFDDYCPNGLQVEGERPVRLLVSGVTASAALLREAAALRADALLVHHGWYWRGDDPRRRRGPRHRAAAGDRPYQAGAPAGGARGASPPDGLTAALAQYVRTAPASF